MSGIKKISRTTARLVGIFALMVVAFSSVQLGWYYLTVYGQPNQFYAVDLPPEIIVGLRSVFRRCFGDNFHEQQVDDKTIRFTYPPTPNLYTQSRMNRQLIRFVTGMPKPLTAEQVKCQ